ncbi:MAG: hypothetical protein P4L79_11745 [Legionella sp.]|uniref:hypothetical protein n=1 Tax=Legionella sp. TaxID=459 RepID=UPI0028422297|nr:hypothetical protein [Legionella sp.]
MVVVSGIASMIEWGLQNPGSALVALISTTVSAVVIGYIADRYSSFSDGTRLGGERPLPRVADQLQNIWRQRGAHLRRMVEETNLENRAGAAA